MTKAAKLASVAGLTILAGLGGSPVFGAAKDQIAARIAAYRELGAAFKNANDGLRANTPQTSMIRISAQQIRDLARRQYSLFPSGSGFQPGVKTAAKAEIWSNADGFRAAQDAFTTRANAFVAATESNDVIKMRVAARALGQSCASCHRAYRVDKN